MLRHYPCGGTVEMSWTPGMTPRFTIRVWGALDESTDYLDRLLGLPRRRVPVAEIEVDQKGR